MPSDKYIIKKAGEVLKIEAGAVNGLKKSMNADFLRAVRLILNCAGRVIVTGIGKSGIMARKIAATLASTGTPAIFLHSTEGLHGDLGAVTKRDVVIALSQSGESREVLEILPAIKKIGAKLIVFTGDKNSSLAEKSDLCLDVSVKKEACPLNLAPTASCMAQLAMGDALAIALLIKRGFKEEDYALLHPGGSLGRKLKTVEDVMRRGADIPRVGEKMNMEKVIFEMTSKKMGCTCVVNGAGKLTGIITDQNLRNHLQRDRNIMKKRAAEIMTRHPKTIAKEALVDEAITMTGERSISTLLIVDKAQKPLGIVHLHDLLKLDR